MKPMKPNDDTVDLFWQLHRTLEEKVGKDALPLDAALIQASYRHFSKLQGKTMDPSYIKP
jgi:hypothetical protein